ncbi:MAG: trypsin-like peptidase domain-containing protein [Clostridiales bacterium]|nr:trypsin-like peptidase domain-containing protein [Clostridiales bacterium]
MKKIRLFLVVLLFLFLGTNAAFAVDTGSLVNFKATKTMNSLTFSDVKSDNWFYSGIKTAFDNGVMDGIGKGHFSPSGTLTKAQAITIAARVHAIYQNKIIPNNTGAYWYLKYYNYASTNGLLPPSITNLDGLDAKNATRAEVAYLFGHILNNGDSAAINNLVIPDISLIDAAYTDSVKKMYSSGIIGGKVGGVFDANGLATRAEIATIIGRVIDPTNRLSNDAKYNSQITGQEGNIQNYRKVIESGNTVFFSSWSDKDSAYDIIRYNKTTKKSDIIYKGTSGTFKSYYPFVGRMILYNNALYLVQDELNSDNSDTKSTLKKIDLETLSITSLYTCDGIESYTIYDGEIYLISSTLNPKWNDSNSDDVPMYLYDVVKLESSNAIKLVSGEDEAYSLSAVNNCLYYIADSSLVQVDLETKKTTSVIEEISAFTICGNVIFYSDLNGSIYKASLSNLSMKKLLYTGDITKTGNVTSIHYYKGTVYFNYDWLARIDKVDMNGIWASVPTRTNHINFGIFDGKLIYTDYDGNDYVAAIGSNPAQQISLSKWLSSMETGKAYVSPVVLPAKTTVTSQKLNAQQIYAACSPAVFRIETYDSDNNLTGSGSGFFISSNGIAVTNYHVIVEDKFKVILSDGREFWPKAILGESDSKDIVIFKIDGTGFPYLKISDSDKVAGGQIIYTLGSPYGLESTISSGLIANPKRSFGDGDTWIQISAPISPGSSGGALIDEYGNVVGITSASIALEDAQNVNLAIPINLIYSILLD